MIYLSVLLIRRDRRLNSFIILPLSFICIFSDLVRLFKPLIMLGIFFIHACLFNTFFSINSKYASSTVIFSSFRNLLRIFLSSTNLAKVRNPPFNDTLGILVIPFLFGLIKPKYILRDDMFLKKIVRITGWASLKKEYFLGSTDESFFPCLN